MNSVSAWEFDWKLSNLADPKLRLAVSVTVWGANRLVQRVPRVSQKTHPRRASDRSFPYQTINVSNSCTPTSSKGSLWKLILNQLGLRSLDSLGKLPLWRTIPEPFLTIIGRKSSITSGNSPAKWLHFRSTNCSATIRTLWLSFQLPSANIDNSVCWPIRWPGD